ncbi:collagen alpha-1(I) chain-like [Suricata suricatta]|uniref:collagen alpha-1(I) chain-like n=1 Tax=Suricata suricatta TaxID=37032 RepID=UPI001155B4B9|nr:collagen alpha-1(I) chain-like [Suricata suricatta]
MEQTAQGRRGLGTGGVRFRKRRPKDVPQGRQGAPGERRGSSPPGGHSAQPSPPTFSGPGAGLRPGAAGEPERRRRQRLTFRRAWPPPPPVGPRSLLSCRKKTALPGSAPSRPGPPHIAIAPTATSATEKPVRHRRSATGPPRPVSMRSRPSPEGSPASQRYLRSTEPDPCATPLAR